MEWKNINEEKPNDSQRVLVCDKGFREVRILTYNDHYKCWDTEDGDDYYCDLNSIEWWMPLPEYKK